MPIGVIVYKGQRLIVLITLGKRRPSNIVIATYY